MRPFVWSSHLHKDAVANTGELSFTLCVFYTFIISCTLTWKERMYVTDKVGDFVEVLNVMQLDWLNLPFGSYKVKCKKLFL